MKNPVVVLNPNSTEAVTCALREALAPLEFEGGPAIVCETLAEGPPGIESDFDVASVIDPICRFVERRAPEAGAFVIACFSDPGLRRARRAVSKPVFGMAESGLLTALTRGERFGVISILPESVARHLGYYRKIGIESRLAADLPIGLGVRELHDANRVEDRLEEVGEELVRKHGADVLVLGCAGMAAYRSGLEQAVGVPVVEPVQAAVTMAIGAVQLGR